jgi:hypothetical protein
MDGSHEGSLLRNEVEELFRDVITMDIPVSKNIQFTFMLTDLPIALREQMVRHIIGVEYGQNHGVDWIPDLEKSSWWSQSMRIMSFGDVYDQEMYFTPDSVMESEGAQTVYHGIIESIQVAYRQLLMLGVPMEDARGILPLHSNMAISWTLNLAALSHIIGKRSCWILQYGYWSYIISGIIEELANKVHPIFRELVLPPCFNRGKFNECKFQTENKRRVDGEDRLPVCPLYFQHNMFVKERTEYQDTSLFWRKHRELVPKYAKLWGCDPYTGEKR